MNYDIVGDVHGCFDELKELLGKLGYMDDRAPAGRQLLFVGDLTDRGPASNKVLRLLLSLNARGLTKYTMGNHDWKLLRALRGEPMKRSRNLRETLKQIAKFGRDFEGQVLKLVESMPLKVCSGKDLLVFHGATRDGVSASEERELALFGEVSGKKDERGNPIRLENWTRDYKGPYRVIARGHSVVQEVTITVSVGGTNIYNLDTGCVFGGKLSALRYPEMQVVQVKARKRYSKL
jgi:hypothetical protein